MTFEKHQRDAVKKRKAEEKRASRQKRKDQPPIDPEATIEDPSIDEPAES
jgi:hypothetical protein